MKIGTFEAVLSVPTGEARREARRADGRTGRAGEPQGADGASKALGGRGAAGRHRTALLASGRQGGQAVKLARCILADLGGEDLGNYEGEIAEPTGEGVSQTGGRARAEGRRGVPGRRKRAAAG